MAFSYTQQRAAQQQALFLAKTKTMEELKALRSIAETSLDKLIIRLALQWKKELTA